MVSFARVKWFKEIARDDVSIAGSKGANIAGLWNAGFPIPNGFVVSSDVFGEFVESTGIKDRISALLQAGDAEGIQKIILTTPIPKDISEEILENYEALDEIKDVRQAIDLIKAFKNDVPVAVRPSSNQDVTHASFLNVKGNDVVKGVRACWASLFTKDAVEKYLQRNVSFDDLSMSVIVQKMVNQEKSGFVISDEKLLVIQGIYGSNDALHESIPDRFLVDRNGLQIIDKQINRQDYTIMHDARSGQKVKVEIVDEYKSNQKISDKHLIEIARLSKEIAEHFGQNCAVEWAISKDAVQILDAKPCVVENQATQKSDDEDPEPDEQPTNPYQEPPFDVPTLQSAEPVVEFPLVPDVLYETRDAVEESHAEEAHQETPVIADSLDHLWKKAHDLRSEIISALENPDLEDEQLSKLTETLKLCNKILKVNQ